MTDFSAWLCIVWSKTSYLRFLFSIRFTLDGLTLTICTINYYTMRQMHVLLVEDNPGDVRLTQEAFQEAKVPAILSVAMDGEEALAFLEKNIRSLPDLILLDLNLPKWSGKEVLQRIKNHSELKRIPVLILTTSKSEQDVMESYHLNANSYLLKPLDFDHFLEVVEKINAFWFQTAILPPHHN